MNCGLFKECKFDNSREDKIRTCDPLHPIQVRYRAAPLPETFCKLINNMQLRAAKVNENLIQRTFIFMKKEFFRNFLKINYNS